MMLSARVIKNICKIFILVFVLSNPLLIKPVFSSEKNIEPLCIEVDENNKCLLYSISIIDLIAHPDEYQNKKVSVVGFFKTGYEGNVIYLSRNDYLYYNTRNGINVTFDKNILSQVNKHDGSYVLIEGVFNKKNLGSFDVTSGSIENVTRIEELKGAHSVKKTNGVKRE